MTPFVLAAAAALLLAAIVATFGYASGKRALQKRIDDAATAYVMQLDDLIHKSVREGKFKAAVNAREIVEKCAALREPLDNMRRQLNSEIDTLMRLVGQGPGANSIEEVYGTIHALQASWPGKRRSIESETRKLLALLGVE